jgi:hypothetical protein
MRSAGVLVESAGDGQLAGAAAVLVAPHRGRRPPQIGTPAGRAAAADFLLLLAGAPSFRQRSGAATLVGGSLAGALGDLRARDSSSLRGPSSSSARFLASHAFGAIFGYLRPRPPAGLFHARRSRASMEARSSSWRRRSALGEAARARILIGLTASCSTRRGSRAPRRSACAATRRGRRAGSAVWRREVAVRRADAAAVGAPSGCAGSAPRRRNDALFADLDRHRLRAAVREALAHLAGLDGRRRPSVPPTAASRALLLLLVGVLLVRFSHAL